MTEVAGLVIGTVALAVVLMAAWRMHRSKDRPPPHVVPLSQVSAAARAAALVAAVLVVAATAGALWLAARTAGPGAGRPPATLAPTRPAAPTSPAVPTTGGGAPAHSESTPLLPVFAAPAGVLLLVAAWLVVRRLRRPPPGEAAARPVLGRSAARTHPPRPAVDALGPRAAVIAHYAELEEELARAHLPRDPAETPAEHLARAAGQGLDTAAARVLAELYGVARYSSRPVGDGDSERAGLSLAASRRNWHRHAGPRRRTEEDL